jgi:peptide deformylase
MSRRPIITLPDPLLRQASAPIERVDDELGRLIDDMLETMYAAPGIGLAAVQVGVPRRLIVVDVAEREEKERAEAAGVGQPKSARKQTTEPASDPIVLINPEIIELGSELAPYEEGCLSIPDVRVDIERPSSVTVRYLDRKGSPRELAADGLLATVLQHEIDHLDGKLIIDFLSRLKRDIIVRRFRKQAKADQSA